MAVQDRLFTADDLANVPVDPHIDKIWELHDGILVERPMSFPAGVLMPRLSYFLYEFVLEHKLNGFMTSVVSIQLSPHTVYVASVTYLSMETQERQPKEDSFVMGSPDLVVEWPMYDPQTTQKRAARYLDGGAKLVWIADPRQHVIDVYRPDNTRTVYNGDMALDGGDVMPGLELPLTKVFEQIK